MKAYIYSVIVCILIASILTQMVSCSRHKKLIRLICGVYLAISIFRPISQINLTTLWNRSSLRQFSADTYIAEGKKTAQEARETIIKDACEAYILDKAKTLGAEISIEFSLNEELYPVFAEIHAETDPAVQRQLQNILTTDLGIPKESQAWIWYQESNSS